MNERSRSSSGGRGRGKERTGPGQKGPRRGTGRPRFKRDEDMEVRGSCRFCAEKVEGVDYKDTNRLKRYLTEKGKIIAKRGTGTCAKHQRQLATAVKRARFVALLAYVGE